MKCKTRLLTLLPLCILLLASACTEPASVESGSGVTSGMDAQTRTVGKVDSIDAAYPPMLANLIAGGILPKANVLQDPDGGGRVGHKNSWDTRFDLLWKSGEFLPIGSRAAAPGCPKGLSFNFLEAKLQGGQVTRVNLVGSDEFGAEYSSGPVAIEPQTPNDKGWTLAIEQELTVTTGHGGNSVDACTVYVSDVVFSPAGP